MIVVSDREKEIQMRSVMADLNTRAEGDEERIVEGYFAVFNSETELFPGAFEEIAPGAFGDIANSDVRALMNHDTAFVLGRSKSGTLQLKVDSKGLWGSIRINENDTDAMNLYQRVKRGDVDQCSFGFNIINEETDFRDDGSIKWTLKEVDVKEVSVVTFPAYADTSVEARKKDYESIQKRKLDKRKNQLRERLKNGAKTSNG